MYRKHLIFELRNDETRRTLLDLWVVGDDSMRENEAFGFTPGVICVP